MCTGTIVGAHRTKTMKKNNRRQIYTTQEIVHENKHTDIIYIVVGRYIIYLHRVVVLYLSSLYIYIYVHVQVPI